MIPQAVFNDFSWSRIFGAIANIYVFLILLYMCAPVFVHFYIKNNKKCEKLKRSFVDLYIIIPLF